MVDMPFLKVPKTQSIKIYVWDEYKMEKRIIDLDDLLTLLNSGRFNGDLSQDHIYYYRTKYERDWYAERSMKTHEEFLKNKAREITI